MYYQGKGVVQDYAAALREFRPLAKQGYARAQLNLGVMYAKGKGVAQDDAQAAEWFLKMMLPIF